MLIAQHVAKDNYRTEDGEKLSENFIGKIIGKLEILPACSENGHRERTKVLDGQKYEVLAQGGHKAKCTESKNRRCEFYYSLQKL